MKIYQFTFILLVVSGCDALTGYKEKSGNQVAEFNREEIKKQVKQALDDYFDSVRKHGLKGEFPYLDHSKDFYWTPPGYDEPISYDSVASILNSRADEFSYISNGYRDLKINPVSPDTAHYTCTVISMMNNKSGEHARYTLEESGTFIKRKDGWKLLNGKTVLKRSARYRLDPGDSL